MASGSVLRVGGIGVVGMFQRGGGGGDRGHSMQGPLARYVDVSKVATVQWWLTPSGDPEAEQWATPPVSVADCPSWRCTDAGLPGGPRRGHYLARSWLWDAATGGKKTTPAHSRGPS